VQEGEGEGGGGGGRTTCAISFRRAGKFAPFKHGEATRSSGSNLTFNGKVDDPASPSLIGQNKKANQLFSEHQNAGHFYFLTIRLHPRSAGTGGDDHTESRHTDL